MKSEQLDSWEDFKDRIHEIRLSLKDSITGVLFRGQSSSRWNLDTTLERNSDLRSIEEYYELISRIRPQIETFTGLKWEKGLSHEEIGALLADYRTANRAFRSGQLPHHEYMLYLRHHGFPSPLIDWTRSPYIAAYFAFGARVEQAASIFVYCESPENSKFGSSDQSSIHSFGPYVQAHRRHFLQQAEYTICTSYSDKWLFSPHASVLTMHIASTEASRMFFGNSICRGPKGPKF
jgi:hypothetical protein